MNQPAASINIEREGDTLRCMAKPVSMVPFLMMLPIVTLVLGVTGFLIISATVKQMFRRDPPLPEYVALGLWLLLVAFTIYFAVLSFRRRRAPHGVVIEDGIVRVYMPDQPRLTRDRKLLHLLGARMSQTRTARGRSSLLLNFGGEGKSVVFIGYPVMELHSVVTAINSMLLIDKHAAFEVMVNEPQRVMAVLPLESPPTLDKPQE